MEFMSKSHVFSYYITTVSSLYGFNNYNTQSSLFYSFAQIHGLIYFWEYRKNMTPLLHNLCDLQLYSLVMCSDHLKTDNTRYPCVVLKWSSLCSRLISSNQPQYVMLTTWAFIHTVEAILIHIITINFNFRTFSPIICTVLIVRDLIHRPSYTVDCFDCTIRPTKG